MKDETLERVWSARKSIAKKCDFDSHKLVKYFQKRTKAIDIEQGKSSRCLKRHS